MVYGGMDGIITTFAIVCAASGANKDDSTIVTMVRHSLTCRHMCTSFLTRAAAATTASASAAGVAVNTGRGQFNRGRYKHGHG
jgi:hypothetical protein